MLSKISLKNFKKPIDKSFNLCYTIYVKQELTTKNFINLEEMEMTKAQEAVIKTVESYMLNRMCKRNEDNRYEVKRKEVDEITENTVSLVIETGLKGDEGTMAAILCRDMVHLFIGKKGGVSCYVKARSGSRKGQQVLYTDGWLGCCHRSMEEFRI